MFLLVVLVVSFYHSVCTSCKNPQVQWNIKSYEQDLVFAPSTTLVEFNFIIKCDGKPTRMSGIEVHFGDNALIPSELVGTDRYVVSLLASTDSYYSAKNQQIRLMQQGNQLAVYTHTPAKKWAGLPKWPFIDFVFGLIPFIVWFAIARKQFNIYDK
ncbi:hypothetical protein RF11_02769 [Thelohanellus kitauei]|uniref:Translocon-associated protein subunit beta n=1 Tax=Thelohanellus kitauei TaxID=669202 RepID=A0A0C2IJ19_THEKT|nr:hypothetical protein RF11_02769 [Thelohanellus kitauei]